MAEVLDPTQLDHTDESSDSPEGQDPQTVYGENFEKLPADRIQELRQILSTVNMKRDMWARMVEIIRCTLRRYFWLGIQHGFWNAETNSLQIGPEGGSLSGERLDNEDLFAGDFNIYTQNGKIFIAVFSQTAAPTRMEASRPGDSQSIQAAEAANQYVRIYEKYNPPKVAQQEVGRLMWTDGRIVAVTTCEENEADYGTQEDEEGNEVPFMTELTEYFGVLESNVPFIEPFAKWPFCRVYRDMDILTAKYENPYFADSLDMSNKSLAPNDEIARMSRIAVAENIAQISSDTLTHLVTEERWWLRPSAFNDLPKDKRAFWIGGQQKQADGSVKQVAGIFPKGCRLKFFGDVYCGAKAVSMSKEVRVMHAMPGTGNSRPSLSDALIPIQMEFNDAVGMYSELIHKCIPRVWIDAGPEEIQAIIEQFARYGEFSPFENPMPGQPLENNFFAEPTIDVPASFPAWVQNLQGPLSQFVTGNLPAIMGQATEEQKTAKGYQMMRDQALGLMAIVWVPYLEFAGHIRAQAAECAGKRDVEQISAVFASQGGKNEVVAVDTAALKAGYFLSAPVTDQNFPEGWTETSNTWKQLMMAPNPIIQQNLGHPENLRGLRDAIGLKDFHIEGEDSWDKQLAEWAEMQKNNGPLPDMEATEQRDQQRAQQAQQAISAIAPGKIAPPLPQMPPVLVSSVPIDEQVDDHVAEALTMFYVLNSPEGQKIKKEALPVWQDGKLHMLAHVAAAQKKGLIIPPPLGAAPPMPLAPPKGDHPTPGGTAGTAPAIAPLPTGGGSPPAPPIGA